MSRIVLASSIANAPDAPHYSREEINLFRNVIDAAYDEICATYTNVGCHERDAETILRLALAVFRHADDGERDPVRLRKLALQSVRRTAERANALAAY